MNAKTFVIKDAPPELIARGLFPGKEITILRKRGRLYHVKCGWTSTAIDEETFNKIIVQ